MSAESHTNPRIEAAARAPRGFEFVGWCWPNWLTGAGLHVFLTDDGCEPPQRTDIRPVYAPRAADGVREETATPPMKALHLAHGSLAAAAGDPRFPDKYRVMYADAASDLDAYLAALSVSTEGREGT